MKARIVDKVALEAINPSALRAYLEFQGWQKAEPYGQFSEVYTSAGKELIIPVSKTIADYASAIGSALQFIAKVESRDDLAIYVDLIQADRDVIRVRAPEADDDGSIGVDPGVEIVQDARNLIAAAASAALDPRRAYHVGKIQKVDEYMRRVRLGQTEHGSFVVTLLAPMPPALSEAKQTSLWPSLEQEPYERQVTRVLTEALHSAHAALVESNRGHGIEAFSNAVSKGVSANLCEAVASIVDQANGADVSVTWARTRPAPTRREQIVFDRADGEILREVARQFRLREPRRDERIIGYVIDLHREEDESAGRITIKALIDKKIRSLFIDLSPMDYNIALEAHKKQAPITLIGDLEPEGQRWRISDPREIQLLDFEP